MKKLITIALLAFVAPVFLNAGDVGWLTDAEAAMAKARNEDKLLVMNFTGSDWCIWCKRLDGEVFSKEDFSKYADENLVLLKLDFPRKGNQSDAEKAQNEALAEKYEIRGFPTVVVLNPDGSKAGQLGYVRGGPDAWLAALQSAVGS